MSTELLDWKEEPLSPLIDEAAWVSEETLYLTTLEHDADNLKFEIDNGDTAEAKVDLTATLLDDFDKIEDLDEWIKNEEPFQSWLDENMIPILDEVDPIPCAPVVPAAQPVKLENVKPAYCLNQPSPQPLPDTRSLMMEFETVFAGMTPGQLTPPQSPPRYAQFAALEPVYQQPQQPQTMVYMAPQEVAHELAVVEELVRTRAENMVQWEGPVSPSSSSNSNFGDCSSSSDDPEWIPEVFSDQESSVGPAKNSRRRSSKPYSRVSPEDRKSRKKEQNKNAATRYRMKKKAEVEEILEEERGLMKHHDKLTEQISDLNREITYLKKLMRDFCKAKGLIP